MKILAIALLLLTSCASYDARLTTLENKTDLVIEVMRQRRLSAERCEALSYGSTICSRNSETACVCAFAHDAQDAENAAIAAELARKAEEAKKAAEGTTPQP